jgi:hypothetical protein
MEVLDHIYPQCFFTANSLGHQPATSQYVEPLTLHTCALVASAIHCVLSDYVIQTKTTVMFSQDDYRGTFCPSPLITFTTKATVLINHTLVVHVAPYLLTPSSSTLLG